MRNVDPCVSRNGTDIGVETVSKRTYVPKNMLRKLAAKEPCLAILHLNVATFRQNKPRESLSDRYGSPTLHIANTQTQTQDADRQQQQPQPMTHEMCNEDLGRPMQETACGRSRNHSSPLRACIAFLAITRLVTSNMQTQTPFTKCGLRIAAS